MGRTFLKDACSPFPQGRRILLPGGGAHWGGLSSTVSSEPLVQREGEEGMGNWGLCGRSFPTHKGP